MQVTQNSPRNLRSYLSHCSITSELRRRRRVCSIHLDGILTSYISSRPAYISVVGRLSECCDNPAGRTAPQPSINSLFYNSQVLSALTGRAKPAHRSSP